MTKIELPGGDTVPPVTFKNFVTELASTALVCLGFLQNPVTKQRETDLPRAAHVIGLLAMLAEKTEGNLDHEETGYLMAVLDDLRIKLQDHLPPTTGQPPAHP